MTHSWQLVVARTACHPARPTRLACDLGGLAVSSYDAPAATATATACSDEPSTLTSSVRTQHLLMITPKLRPGPSPTWLSAQAPDPSIPYTRPLFSHEHGPSIRTVLRKRTALRVAGGAPDTSGGTSPPASSRISRRGDTLLPLLRARTNHHPPWATSPARARQGDLPQLRRSSPGTVQSNSGCCGGRQDVGKDSSIKRHVSLTPTVGSSRCASVRGTCTTAYAPLLNRIAESDPGADSQHEAQPQRLSTP
ncbi:hypothetical protein C8Q73DRAFT_135410 [Cubamyces lactineus]|nr:hypothetical protein C8Q73DRAFT_135410 [Cubamyces lactineus]